MKEKISEISLSTSKRLRKVVTVPTNALFGSNGSVKHSTESSRSDHGAYSGLGPRGYRTELAFRRAANICRDQIPGECSPSLFTSRRVRVGGFAFSRVAGVGQLRPNLCRRLLRWNYFNSGQCYRRTS